MMAVVHELWQPVALACLGFVGFFLLHLLVWRTPLRRGLAYGWLFGLLIVGAVLAPVLWHLFGLDAWDRHALPAASLYLLLAMLYLHFYSGLARSLSVRILSELASTQCRHLDMAELSRRYPLADILARRLDALVATGWIERHEGGYRNLARGHRWARVLRGIARLYRQDVTG
ncbi:MAG: hypothetical protein MPN21_18545 [Thermoanaerobaculia bacterium]|nr:hypothetical protein [Thermoanaerobaculia bacterium]